MNQDDNFLLHPDLKPYFDDLLPNILAESDRGAVLLGISQVDEHLKKLFENLLPSNTSNNRKKEIFNYTGPFGSLASKLDVALVCRILPSDIVNAIHKIRKIRNDIAHKTASFELVDYQEKLYEIFSLLGPNLDVGINRLTINFMMENMLSKLTEIDHPINEGKSLFDSKPEALQYLSENGSVLKTLESQRPRWEFAIGVGIICGMILLYRDKIKKSLGADNTLLKLIDEKKIEQA